MKIFGLSLRRGDSLRSPRALSSTLSLRSDEASGGGPPPPGPGDYPLDDDGTLAAAFGRGWAPTNSPRYVRADYTYQAPATGNAAIAAPKLANIFTTQAGVVAPGTRVAMEMVLIAAPSHGGDFTQVGFSVVPSSGGAPSGPPINPGIVRAGGVNTFYGDGGVSMVLTGPLNGMRIGVELDGSTGSVLFRSSDGVAGSAVLFNPAHALSFVLNITDNGVVPNGTTVSVELCPRAADMQLAYTAGCIDRFGNPV